MYKKFKNIKLLSLIRWYIAKYILRAKYLDFESINGPMILDLKTDGVSKAIAFYGAREIDKVHIINSLDLEGKNVIDLGSNIGYYSLLLSDKVGKFGHIYCVEPDSRNINLLEMNLALAKNKNYSINQVAISTKNGKQDLYRSKKSNLSSLINHEFLFNSASESESFKESIKTITYKYLIDEIERSDIYLIRMDIEGYEQYVIPQIIKCTPNAKILFEVHSLDYGEDFSVFLNHLIEKYEIEKLVSTQGGKNILTNKFNLKPSLKINSDGRTRYIFESITGQKITEVIMHNPRILRYVLLSPKKS